MPTFRSENYFAVAADMDSFNRAINITTRDIAPAAILKFKKVIALELLTSVTMRTPVKTGRARSNWNVTRSRPSRAVNVNRFDKGGSKTILRGARHIERSKEGENIYITNNVHYITDLDRGTSRQQAPMGIGRLAVEEVILRHA